jgi:hypothetical protein
MLSNALCFSFTVRVGRSNSSPHNAIEPDDGLLKLHPPKPAPPVGKLGRDEQRPGRAVPPQDWPSVFDIVTIAVVKGQGRKKSGACPSERRRSWTAASGTMSKPS